MPDYVVTANSTPQNAPGGATHLTSASSIGTYLDQDSPDTNTTTENRFKLAYDGFTGDRQSALVKSDFSGLPSGETIVSATLYLYLVMTGGDSTHDYASHRMLQDWVHDEATHNVYSTGNSWGTAGALSDGTDRVSTPDGTQTGFDMSTTGVWMSLDVTDYVTEVHDNAGNNYGVGVYRTDQDSNSNSTVQFRSENAPDGQRWELVIETTSGGSTTHNDSISQDQEHEATFAAELTAEAAIAQALQVDASAAAAATFAASIEVATQVGVSAEAAAVYEAALSQGLSVDAAVVAGLLVEAALSQGLSVAYVVDSDVSIEAAISEAISAGMTTSVQAEFASSLSAGIVAEAVTSVIADLNVQISEGAQIGATSTATAVLSDGITVAVQAELTVTGVTLDGSIVTPDGRTFTVALHTRTFTPAAEARVFTVE